MPLVEVVPEGHTFSEQPYHFLHHAVRKKDNTITNLRAVFGRSIYKKCQSYTDKKEMHRYMISVDV